VPSLRRAVGLGVDWVELDVRLTVDGYPVLLHDERLDRTTNGAGLISETSLAALRTLDAGGAPLPTLAEALASLGPATRCLIEINREERGGPEVVGAVVAAVAAAGMEARVRLISFEESLLIETRRQAPHLPRGIIGSRSLDELFGVADRLECAAIHPNLK